MTDIQWIDQTEREFLASLTPPLAVVGKRGRFGTPGEEAIAKARREGFGFLGDKGHPNTPVKAVREPKKVSLEKPAAPAAAPAAPAQAPAEQTKTVVMPTQTPKTDAGVIRAWAKANGHTVGERGRIHPTLIALYATSNGGTVPVKPVTAEGPVAKAPVKEVRVRSQHVAYGLVRRGDLPKHVSEPLLAITSCFRCKKTVGYCKCSEGVQMPKWAGGETAVFLKADAK